VTTREQVQQPTKSTAKPPPRRKPLVKPPREKAPRTKEFRIARRRSLIWSLAALTVFVLVLLGAAMSPLADIEEVQVVGAATPEHVAAIQAASGLSEGDSIVTFLPGRVANKVEGLPWVASAAVDRDLPNLVRITVTERVPVGWAKSGSRVVVVDGTGRVLWREDAPPTGLPELVGVADLAGPGDTVRPRILPAAAEALGPDLSARTASVLLNDGAVTVQVNSGPQLRFGAPTQVAAKARVAAAVLAALGGNPVSYIDVTVPAAPVSG
jgi:cell division protein FtsQ